MFKLKKKLVLHELSLSNIWYIFFLRIFFSEIFYINISGILKNLKIVQILTKSKIYWANYQDYKDFAGTYSHKLNKNIHFSEYISKILVNKIWDEDVKDVYLKKEYLVACLSYTIRKDCVKIFEIFEISKILAKNNTKIYILANRNFFFRNIEKKYYLDYSFKILPNINFSYLGHFLNSLIFIFVALYKKFVLLLSFDKNFSLSNERKNKKIINKVIYFPHKGIFYLDHLKDQFYSSDNDSFLNKNKIVHIEWELGSIDKRSFVFYKKNKIPLKIWNSLVYRKLAIILKLKSILKKLNFVRKLYHYDILLIFLFSVFKIVKAQEKLLNFKEAKLALVGYDFLFPLELSLALKKSGIKTVCVQERILVSGFAHKMIFDHYFSIGPQSTKLLKQKMSKTILNFHKYYLSQTDLPNLKKYESKKIFNLNCLVIDLHSVEDWYLNGTSLNNWRDNNEFYKNIIELAKKHNNINFLIKSKNYNWIRNEFLAKTVQKIKSTKNITILKDSKKWKPENFLGYADFAVARHSSLSDQVLYLNKPVLIHDLNGHPSKIFPFDKNIICKNNKDLEKKFILLTKDIAAYNKKLNKTRKLIFYHNSIVNLNTFLEKTLQ